MISCSDSFDSVPVRTVLRAANRPKTHRPCCEVIKPKPSVKSQSPIVNHALTAKHNRSLTKMYIDKFMEQKHNKSSNQTKRCDTQEGHQSRLHLQNYLHKKRVMKNINSSSKATRPLMRTLAIQDVQGVDLFGANNNGHKDYPQLGTRTILKTHVTEQEKKDTETIQAKEGKVQSLTASLVKTKEMKIVRLEPSSATLRDTVKHLAGYKMAESQVIFQSQIQEEFVIEESIIQERCSLNYFWVIKDFNSNEYFSQHLAVQRRLGFCLSLKKLLVNRTSLVSNQLLVYQLIAKDHPNILKYYQNILNGREEYLLLREYYDSYLKSQLITKTEFKRYFKDIVLAVEELLRQGIWYATRLYDNLVLVRHTCKLMNFQFCEIQSCSRTELGFRYRQILVTVAQMMLNQVTQSDPSRDFSFLAFLANLEPSQDFSRLLQHPYLDQQFDLIVL